MAARLPNPACSRIVLIGAGTVPAELDLPSLPGLHGLLTSLRGRLSGTVERPTTLYHPRSAAKVCAAVRRAAAEATDLLLVYCAGHVLPDQDGRPRLVVAGTVPGELAATAVSMDELTGYIARSPAPIKVLLLDCAGWTIAVPGTATLAGGRSRTPTAFTEALLAALDNPDPPSFDRLRRRIDQELVRRDEPKTQASAAHVVLVGGLSREQPLKDQPPDTVPDLPDRSATADVRFGTDPATVATNDRGGITVFAVLDGLLAISTAASALWLSGWGHLLTGALAIILLLGLLALGGEVAGRKRPGTTTMLRFDEDGITLHRLAADPLHIPWSDVVTAGLLQPKRSVGPVQDYVVTVKLRPGVTPPDLDQLLLGAVDRLGYLGLVRVGDLDIHTHEVLAEMDRYAEDKTARGNRDWCARHPELRPLLD